MIAEIGLFCLILALVAAVCLTIIPTIGLYTKKDSWILSASYYAPLLCALIIISYACLTLCFINDDFTVTYVLLNSSLSLPWQYKICAVWGGHEGSMLLWVSILTLWMMAVSWGSKTLLIAFKTRVLVILGGLNTGFILFLLLTSNPFARQFQLLDSPGRDLNPLLQDPGFLFHPPMLYMGYVGFSVAFAFAIASLWLGQLESTWAKWTRPWTLAAWCCLTAGITLGSWWAYRELGWGGWWFWDPVENASFMPWLVGTALIHSLVVSEQRQQCVSWTILLAISAFSLSLVGTFLVRSGVLTSVHAFAVDPLRGTYILAFLSAVVGGSLLLFALRANSLPVQTRLKLLSRDNALLLNNVILVVMMLTVLMGTIYPLIIEGLGLGKLSVGPPYFNIVFVPLMLLLLLLMGIGIHLNWQDNTLAQLKNRLGSVAGLSIILPTIMIVLLGYSLKLYPLIGLIFATWVMISTAKLVYLRTKKQVFYQLGQAFYGMVIAHLGIGVTVIGIAVSSGYGEQNDVSLAVGESTTIAGYDLRFDQQQPLKGPNYQGTKTYFTIAKGHHHRIIMPEKRIYNIGQMALTESAIDVSPFRDVYVALGSPLADNTWAVRVYFKPLVRWIWAGGCLILLGGLLALTDRRYFVSPKKIAIQAKDS